MIKCNGLVCGLKTLKLTIAFTFSFANLGKYFTNLPYTIALQRADLKLKTKHKFIFIAPIPPKTKINA